MYVYVTYYNFKRQLCHHDGSPCKREEGGHHTKRLVYWPLFFLFKILQLRDSTTPIISLQCNAVVDNQHHFVGAPLNFCWSPFVGCRFVVSFSCPFFPPCPADLFTGYKGDLNFPSLWCLLSGLFVQPQMAKLVVYKSYHQNAKSRGNGME